MISSRLFKNNNKFFSTTIIKNNIRGKKYVDNKYSNKIYCNDISIRAIKYAYEGKNLAEKQSKCFFVNIQPFETIKVNDTEICKWGFDDNTRKIIHYGAIPIIKKSLPYVIGGYAFYCIVEGMSITSIIKFSSVALLYKHTYFWPFILPGIICL